MTMTFNLHPTRIGAAHHRPSQRFTRTLFSVPLTLRHLANGGIRVSLGVSLDISQGGLGAIVPGGLRVGEIVEVEVQFPGRCLNTVAIVRYATNVRSGFEFVGLTSQERQEIARATAHA